MPVVGRKGSAATRENDGSRRAREWDDLQHIIGALRCRLPVRRRVQYGAAADGADAASVRAGLAVLRRGQVNRLATRDAAREVAVRLKAALVREQLVAAGRRSAQLAAGRRGCHGRAGRCRGGAVRERVRGRDAAQLSLACAPVRPPVDDGEAPAGRGAGGRGHQRTLWADHVVATTSAGHGRRGRSCYGRRGCGTLGRRVFVVVGVGAVGVGDSNSSSSNSGVRKCIIMALDRSTVRGAHRHRRALPIGTALGEHLAVTPRTTVTVAVSGRRRRPRTTTPSTIASLRRHFTDHIRGAQVKHSDFYISIFITAARAAAPPRYGCGRRWRHGAGTTGGWPRAPPGTGGGEGTSAHGAAVLLRRSSTHR